MSANASDGRSAAGVCTVGRAAPSQTSRSRSTRKYAGGPTSMGASTAQRWSGSSDRSTNTSFVGPAGNTSGCAGIPPRREGSWLTSTDASRGCSRTGSLARAPAAGRWEPDELRGSRPVLRAPGAAMPPATHPGVSGTWHDDAGITRELVRSSRVPRARRGTDGVPGATSPGPLATGDDQRRRG